MDWDTFALAGLVLIDTKLLLGFSSVMLRMETFSRLSLTLGRVTGPVAFMLHSKTLSLAIFTQ